MTYREIEPDMMPDLQMFGANIYLLIALLIVGGVGLVLLIAFWTSIKIGIWNLQKRRAERQRRQEVFRPDGVPYPPSDRGICEVCGRFFPKVYHLPTGERLCPDDYHARYG